MVHSDDAVGQSAAASLQQIPFASLQHFLEISPDALLCVNQAGTIIRANTQVARLFGYTEAELRGMLLENLLPFRFREQHQIYRQQYAAAPRTRPMGAGLQLFGLRRDRSEFPVDISLRPLLLDGDLHTLAAIRDVTVLVASERQRTAQAQYLQLLTDLINLAPDAILLRDPLSRITFWNQGAQDLYGWSAQEAQGRVSHTLLQTTFSHGRATLDTLLEQAGRWEGELVQITRSGTLVRVESRQALIRDKAGAVLAILEVNRDVTERLQQMRAMQTAHTLEVEQERFFHQILDASPSSMYLVEGLEARLIFANRATTQVWGAQWPVGQSMHAFLQAHEIALLDSQGIPLPEEQSATMRALRLGETILSHEELIRRPDASRLPVLVYAVPFTLPGRRKGIGEPMALVIHQDVTILKEINDLKDEFISIAAHELRAPLTVLVGYADMLVRRSRRGQGSPLSPWQQEALAEIRQATGRLATMTEDLLDVTRLQSGRLTLQLETLNLVPLVQRIARTLQQTTGKHQIEISLTQDTAITHVDGGRVEQILTNLIGNAIKYSPQGGPVRITIEKEEGAQQVLLQVQDHGIGIPRHQHTQIFGRFMRADNARAQGIRGTGLGLYLCRELATRQGGQLWFESEEGQGSTFFLALPLEPGDQQEEEAAASAEVI